MLQLQIVQAALRPLALELAKVYKPCALLAKKTELVEGVGDTHGIRPRRKEDIVDWLVRVLYRLAYCDHPPLSYWVRFVRVRVSSVRVRVSSVRVRVRVSSVRVRDMVTVTVRVTFTVTVTVTVRIRLRDMVTVTVRVRVMVRIVVYLVLNCYQCGIYLRDRISSVFPLLRGFSALRLEICHSGIYLWH